MRNDVDARPAGSAAAGQGTIIEIEAKLGHIIDMDSRDRIHLPILTESVLNRENARVRTSFESKMTVVSRFPMSWRECFDPRQFYLPYIGTTPSYE